MTAGPDRWIRWTTIGCVALLALIAGTVSNLHMHLLVELHGQPGWVAATHWCHSRECHERLPPSPALSRSMAGLKKRLFLYGPVHRAQMLAKAQGGRVLALRKVGAELYLAA
jgi:hypothetical protein